MGCYTEQIRKLRDTYGDKNYPKERCSLFFREVERYTDDLLTRSIDKLIYEEKYPPMPPKIIETILEVQTADLQYRKEEFLGNELENAAKFSHNPEFASLCLSVIKDVTSGRMSKSQYEQAMSYIDTYCDQLEMAGKQFFCKDCGNHGYAFKSDDKGCRHLFRCHCSYGNKKPHATKYKDASGEISEIKLSVFNNKEKWWEK